nr:MAG TPA: hypothetical protein [Crassvirales sp.]
MVLVLIIKFVLMLLFITLVFMLNIKEVLL